MSLQSFFFGLIFLDYRDASAETCYVLFHNNNFLIYILNFSPLSGTEYRITGNVVKSGWGGGSGILPRASLFVLLGQLYVYHEIHENDRKKEKCKVRVATKTHDQDDTSHAIFNTISGTCWNVSEFIDFYLKKKIATGRHVSRLWSVIFLSLSKFHYQNDENRVLRIFEIFLCMDS